MEESQGWIERSFSLPEEEQLTIYCQNFNVFMTVIINRQELIRNNYDIKSSESYEFTKIRKYILQALCVSYHLTILTGSFLGMIWLSHGSMSGNWSTSWFLMPLITDVFSWIQFETFSFSSNLDEEIRGKQWNEGKLK